MHTLAAPFVAAPAYRFRLAVNESDLDAAQRLRFEVFNMELREGLAESWQTRRDSDRFDEVCDHLLVEHTETGAVVGTYRLQTGSMALLHHGFYSAQEFDFAPFIPFSTEIVELGRACVHRDHRKMNVVNLLWRGIAEYARARNARYLLGCSSVTSVDPAVGHAVAQKLLPRFLAPAPFQTAPSAAHILSEAEPSSDCGEPPRLLRAYLAVGAKICGAPALDREFGTIDFLTFLDLTNLPAVVQNRYCLQNVPF